MARVAVVNTSEDLSELLKDLLEQEGHEVTIAYVRDIRRGRLSFERFVEETRTEAVVYDIALPYDVNWEMLQRLRALPRVRGLPFVLTTTNAEALTQIVGEHDAHEIVGKPFDLQDLLDAVNRALERPRGDSRAEL